MHSTHTVTHRSWLAALERTFFFIGSVALAIWVTTALGLAVYQTTAGRHLGATPRDGMLAGGLATRTRAEASASGVVGRIVIPSAGISAIVAEGVDEGTLDRAVGHVTGSAFPGEAGNVALAAHRDGLFGGLANIRRGDEVRLDTPDGGFRYRVVDLAIVPPTRTDLVQAGDGPGLTLVTCYPFHALGPAPDRFIVRAALIGSS